MSASVQRRLVGSLIRAASTAAADTSGQTKPGVDLFAQHNVYVKQQASGTAAWRKEWEVVWYKPGSKRLGKVLPNGGSFFRHLKCGGEHACSNMSQSAKNHKCGKVMIYEKPADWTLCKHICARTSKSSLLQAKFVPDAADGENVPASKVKLVPIQDYMMSFSQANKCKELLAEALFESCGGVSLAFVEAPR